MKNKIVRVLMVFLLSFQMVVRADGGESTGGFFDSFTSGISDAFDAAVDKVEAVGQAILDGPGGKVIGFVADTGGVIIDQTGKAIGRIVNGVAVAFDYTPLGVVVTLIKGGTPSPTEIIMTSPLAAAIMAAKQNYEQNQAEEKKKQEENKKQDEVQKDDNNPKGDDVKKDDDKPKDDNKNNDNKDNDNKNKGKDSDPFGKLTDIIKTVAGLMAVGKIEEVLDLLKKVKKIIDLLDTASDIKDLYDDINDLIDKFKDKVNDSDMSDEEKEILNQCADDICCILKEGGDDMDEKLDKVVDNTEDKLVSEEVKETHDDTKDKGKDKDKDKNKDKDKDKNKDKDKKDDKPKNNDDNPKNNDDKSVDDLIDIVNDESKPKEEREEAAHELADKLEEEGYDKEVVDAADALADQIRDGLVDVGEQLLQLAEQMAVSKLEGTLEKYLGKENAAAIAKYADKIVKGEMTIEDALKDGLNKVIDDKLPQNTANAVKEMLTAIEEGDGLDDVMDSIEDLAQAAAHDGVASLLADSGLSKEQQQDVMDTLDKLLEGDWEGAWDTAKGGVANYVSSVVEEKFGKEAGDKAKDAISSLLNGDGEGFLNNTVDTLTTIASTELEKRIGATLDKLTQKYPLLGKVFDALGINSGSIMGTLSNCWNALKDGKLGEFLKDLVSKIADALKNLVEKLINFAKDLVGKLANFVSDFLSDLVNGLLDKLSEALKTAFDAFVKLFKDLEGKLKSAAGYFLGNEKGDGSTLIEINNNLQNIIQKNVFKTNQISN